MSLSAQRRSGHDNLHLRRIRFFLERLSASLPFARVRYATIRRERLARDAIAAARARSRLPPPIEMPFIYLSI